MEEDEGGIGSDPVITVTSNMLTEQRRSESRRAIMRVVKVCSKTDEGLARLNNISNEGVMLSVGFQLFLNDQITLFLTEDRSIDGTIVWLDDRYCGIKFCSPIDAEAFLVEIAGKNRRDGARPFRLAAEAPGMVATPGGIYPIRVENISQRGMGISHTGQFVAGLAVHIRLPSGLQRRGVVRWSDDRFAGIEVLQPLSVEDLGSARRLATINSVPFEE